MPPTKRKPNCHPNKPHHAKGLCMACYSSQWSNLFPQKRKAKDERYRERNKDQIRAKAAKYRSLNKYLVRTYGISLEDKALLIAQQGGVCAICHDCAPTQVDHNHATGEVRGILCNFCNLGLGKFRDDPAILVRAVSYLSQRGYAPVPPRKGKTKTATGQLSVFAQE